MLFAPLITRIGILKDEIKSIEKQINDSLKENNYPVQQNAIEEKEEKPKKKKKTKQTQNTVIIEKQTIIIAQQPVPFSKEENKSLWNNYQNKK